MVNIRSETRKPPLIINPFMTEVPVMYSRENQWTGFYMIGTSFMKELNLLYSSEFIGRSKYIFWGIYKGWLQQVIKL